MRSEPGGLPWVAMGLAVAVLTVSAGGYDLLADPIGWLLVGYGASRLRLERADRARLGWLVGASVLVALVLWPAPVATRFAAADPSLAWAASLPGIGVAIVLCGALATVARRADDAAAGRWWEVARTLAVIAGVAPVLVFGGGLHALGAATEVLSVAAPIVLAALAVRYARRPWAAPYPPGSDLSSG